MRTTSAFLGLLGALAIPANAHAQEMAPLRTKSPAMIATGVTSLTLGSVAVGLGIPFIVLGAHSYVVGGAACDGCGPHVVPGYAPYVAGGVIAVVAGALAIFGGIPLVYFGAKREHGAVAWLTPGGIAGMF